MRKKANTMLDDILTMHELADYLKLNEKTAYRLVAQGEIPGFKVGGSWRFRRGDIIEWIKEQMQQRKHG
jgi:excisionase family DNA binding protein